MALFNKTKEELLPEQFPEHIAFIMDGNGRWAKKRGLPENSGHREGAKTFKKIQDTVKILVSKYYFLCFFY